MHLEQTLHQMRSMRLATMADCLQQRLKNGDHQDLSHEEFISLLIEDEYGNSSFNIIDDAGEVYGIIREAKGAIGVAAQQ